MTRLATLATLALACTLPLARPALGAEPAKAPQPTVAVLYFDYDGKDEDVAVLRKGLAQMLMHRAE